MRKIRISRRKAGNARQLPLPFGLKQEREKIQNRAYNLGADNRERENILDRIAVLEAKIHEQTTRALHEGRDSIWRGVHRLQAQKAELKQKVKEIEKQLH